MTYIVEDGGILVPCRLFRCGLCWPTKCKSRTFQVPIYNIDLDLPPEQRWLNITKNYAKYAPQIMKKNTLNIPGFCATFRGEYRFVHG